MVTGRSPVPCPIGPIYYLLLVFFRAAGHPALDKHANKINIKQQFDMFISLRIPYSFFNVHWWKVWTNLDLSGLDGSLRRHKADPNCCLDKIIQNAWKRIDWIDPLARFSKSMVRD